MYKNQKRIWGIKLSLLSPGQILLGPNFLIGTEKIEGMDIPFKELQVGFIFAILSIIRYELED
jgi:hypothetical protein